jgi:hypothetical protein
MPLVVTGPAIIRSLCLFAVVELLVVRRRVLPRLHIQAGDSHFTGTMVHLVMVFYGPTEAAINKSWRPGDFEKVN